MKFPCCFQIIPKRFKIHIHVLVHKGLLSSGRMPCIFETFLLRKIHCSKYFKGSDFQSHIFGNILGKSFQIVVIFSWIILLDNAVAAEKIAKLYFLHNPEENHPPNTSVSEPLQSWPLPFQTRSNTVTLFILKSVAGMATDLTLNYSNFAPLNDWNFAPLHVCIIIMLR